MKLLSAFRCNRPKPVTKDELDERVIWIINSINSFGNRIMSTLEETAADEAASLASLNTLVTDLGTKLNAQTTLINDQTTLIQQLKDQLANAGTTLTPEQQATLDAIDANAKLAKSVADTADATVAPSAPAPAAPAPSGDGTSE
jgi:peptidoglycan hydrolase CwlO-like protein